MAEYLGFSKFKDMVVEQTGGEHNLNVEYYDSKLFPSNFSFLDSDKKYNQILLKVKLTSPFNGKTKKLEFLQKSKDW